MQGRWQRFQLPQPAGFILAGRKGLWVGTQGFLAFVDLQGRLTPAGLPIGGMDVRPYTVGPDDSLWFSDEGGNVIARATPDGSVAASYTTLGSPGISDMKVDANGNVWVAESHRIEEFQKEYIPLPNIVSANRLLFDSSGNLWYSDPAGDTIGFVTKDGRRLCYRLPLSNVKSCR
jgi:streptogramin lyase